MAHPQAAVLSKNSPAALPGKAPALLCALDGRTAHDGRSGGGKPGGSSPVSRCRFLRRGRVPGERGRSRSGFRLLPPVFRENGIPFLRQFAFRRLGKIPLLLPGEGIRCTPIARCHLHGHPSHFLQPDFHPGMGGIILYTGPVTLLGLPELTGLHHIAGHQAGGYSQAAQKQCACSGEMHTISPPVLSQKKRHRIHTSGQTARVHVIAGPALKFPGHQIPQLQPGQIPRRRLPLLQNLLPCSTGSRLLYLLDHIGQFRYISGNAQVFF